MDWSGFQFVKKTAVAGDISGKFQKINKKTCFFLPLPVKLIYLAEILYK